MVFDIYQRDGKVIPPLSIMGSKGSVYLILKPAKPGCLFHAYDRHAYTFFARAGRHTVIRGKGHSK